MKADKDGGPAFPAVFMEKTESGTLRDVVVPGMSLRDWFAGRFVAGLISNPEFQTDTSDPQKVPQELARLGYQLADAMLSAREKGTK